MRLKITKAMLLFWTVFIGVGAYVGGICMLVKPDGSILQMQNLLPYFGVLPFSDVLFQDYVFSGIMLIIVNGISNTTAAVFICKNKRIGYVLGTVFGFTLMLWIIIQFIIFPTNLLDILYFTFGAIQFVTGYVALISYNQENFVLNPGDYPNIKEQSDTLVVYFSRKRYTEKIAYERADALQAEILELTTDEMTKGDAGFWWCGRFAMHRWKMKINERDVNMEKYNRIVIVSPVWVFRMAAPIRDFVAYYGNQLIAKDVSVIFNHFNPWLPKGAVNEIRRYVPVKSVESRTTMLGRTF
ncbi:MAG: flavodoxin family protein [Christensenellales bacterium]